MPLELDIVTLSVLSWNLTSAELHDDRQGVVSLDNLEITRNFKVVRIRDEDHNITNDYISNPFTMQWLQLPPAPVREC
uniref:Uncharacterized protein n=1 Tax=Salix viminalis TaxID=40686 RepID=A0A6N2L4S5_SALVM